MEICTGGGSKFVLPKVDHFVDKGRVPVDEGAQKVIRIKGNFMGVIVGDFFVTGDAIISNPQVRDEEPATVRATRQVDDSLGRVLEGGLGNVGKTPLKDFKRRYMFEQIFFKMIKPFLNFYVSYTREQ